MLIFYFFAIELKLQLIDNLLQTVHSISLPVRTKGKNVFLPLVVAYETVVQTYRIWDKLL